MSEESDLEKFGEWRTIREFPMYEMRKRGDVRTLIGKDLLRSRPHQYAKANGPYVTLYLKGMPKTRFVRDLIKEVFPEL